ncbi:uncharacterized protein LOC107003807 [Solanum pennellii]|uniref:Uncharacterized protein LOC107003807 n=1 Tax=Solanum pennellii TaxID=28526 RepID=A0ABM1FJ11_SOLPN|nr:uncharacterized protein LOC107003807 [Solanum pennellii]
MAPLAFNGDNYQIWAVRTETYLDAMDMWEAVKEDYEVPLLPNNPTIARIKNHKDGKTKKSKARPVYFQQFFFNLHSNYVSKVSKIHQGLSQANSVRLIGSVFNNLLIVEKILVTAQERFEVTITTLENPKDLSKITFAELLNAFQTQEQRRVMREEGNTEGALFNKPQDGGKNKNKKNKKNGEGISTSTTKEKTGHSKKSYPPCKHCNKKGHPPYKCWRRTDAKCSKCNQLGLARTIVSNMKQRLKLLMVKRDKQDKKSFLGIFIGYSSVSKAYKVFQPQTENIIFSRDVYFIENEEWCWENSKKFVVNTSDKAKKSSTQFFEKKISLSRQDEMEEIYVEQPEGFVKKGNEYKEKNTRHIEDFKQEMMQDFERTNLGLMSYFLGMEIKDEQDEVFICQKNYAKEILKKFNMEDCKDMNTPMNQKEKLIKNDGAEKVEKTYFRGLVGCLMYLTATRPDILYVVSILSRFMHCSSEVHLKAAKQVVRYIKGTTNYGVKFQKKIDLKLLGYSDSVWVGSADDMKSISGYCFSLGSGIFSWCSMKQDIVAQSTSEAKFVAATTAVNQALLLRKIFGDLHINQTKGTEVIVDNQSAIAISHNPIFHGKIKHFSIKLFFLRDVQNNDDVILLYCKTEEQLTDIFTKLLSGNKFQLLRQKHGVCSS